MTVLGPAQIYGYARGAGFNVAEAITATAVALAESGGKTDAHCLNCVPGVTEDSRGLWQVNVAPNAHPDLAGWNLMDPATNARAAYQISSGGKSFTPWSTFTSGAYTSHLGDASAAAGSPTLTGPLQTTGGGSSSSGASGISASGLNLNPLDGFGIPSAISSSIAKDTLKVVIEGVLILGGASLVVIGLYRTVQPAVQKVAQVTGKAAMAAAVA